MTVDKEMPVKRQLSVPTAGKQQNLTQATSQNNVTQYNIHKTVMSVLEMTGVQGQRQDAVNNLDVAAIEMSP